MATMKWFHLSHEQVVDVIEFRLVGAGLALPLEHGRCMKRGQSKPSPYETLK